MKNNSLIDLHIHTNNSDGEFTTSNIVEKIKKSGITTFSITDHDSINSCNELQKINLSGLDYINGIEISSNFSGYNIHLLCYDFNDSDKQISELMNYIANSRKDRMIEMIETLYDLHKIKIKETDIEQILNKKGVIGKPHLIDILMKYGYGKTNNEIYKNYLEDIHTNRNYRIFFGIANDAIKKASGISILAHPKEIENEYGIDVESIIRQLKEQGLDGIEVYNNIHSLSDIKRYLELAKKYNLLISGGSDYHGPFTTPNATLGCLSKEGIQLSKLSVVEYIKKRH